MKTALCLSGDGARIPIKAGMLKYYRETGIQHDVVYATSSGSLVGAMYHAGDLDKFIEVLLKLKNDDVYKWTNPFEPFTHKAALFDTSPLQRVITKNVDVNAIKQNLIPLLVNITNLETGARNAIHLNALSNSSDFVCKVLLTSCSLPCLFPVQEIGETQYCDGGLTNDYCIAQAAEEGAERIILLTSMAFEKKEVKNAIDALEQVARIAITSQLSREIEMVRKQGVEVIVVKPEKPTHVGILDFSYKDKQGLIDLGYELAKSKLEGIK